MRNGNHLLNVYEPLEEIFNTKVHYNRHCIIYYNAKETVQG